MAGIVLTCPSTVNYCYSLGMLETIGMIMPCLRLLSWYGVVVARRNRSIAIMVGLTLEPDAGLSIGSRVNRTGRNRSGYRGNRWNRTGTVPVPAGFKPMEFKMLNLNSKK
jgi:hypothetical protein